MTPRLLALAAFALLGIALLCVPAAAAVGFPQNPVLDSFNTPDGPLSTSWASPAASPFGVTIVSGAAAGTPSGGGAVWNPTSFTDAEVYATLPALPTAAHSATLFLRVQNQARNGLPPAGFDYSGYLLEVYPDRVQLDKYDGNSAPVVLQNITVNPAAGDAYGATAVGSTITVYRRPAGTTTWSAIGTPIDDSTYASGYIGFNLGDGTASLDDFGGGPATAGPPVSVTAPAIGGVAQQGRTLTASDGTWTNGPTDFAHQWQDCDAGGGSCSPIDSATSPTYLVQGTDVGHTIRVVVTATGPTGSGSATSGATLPVVPASATVFPQNAILDAFTGPDGPLGSSWTSPSGSPFAVSVASNHAVGTASGGGAVWNGASFTDTEVYATLPTLPSAAHSATLFLRVQNQARNGLPPAGFDYSGYLLEVYPDRVQLDKYDGNSAPVVLQNITVNPAAGDAYGATAIGSTITVYRKPAGSSTWATIGTPTTDTTYASGYIGFNLGDGTGTLDDFGGGGAAAPGPNGPVLVLVAHPDDEALAFSGIIESARAAGRRVYVAVVTNGDAAGTGSDSGYCGAGAGNAATTAHYGLTRDGETKAGMGVLGLTWSSTLSASDIFFLGYPDSALTAIAGSATPFTGDATGLHHTYAEDGDGSTLTCNGDLHFLATGSHAPLDAPDLAGDFDRLLTLTHPTDIYTHSPYEGHPDHVVVYKQVVAAVQRANLSVTLHESMLHPQGVDNCQELSAAQWPNPADTGNNPLARFTPSLDVTAPPLPACSASPTSSGWGTPGPPTELVPVPADMLLPTEAANKKWQVISKYASQIDCSQSAGGVYNNAAECGYPRAFVKAHEWFWTERFPTPAPPANLTLPTIAGTPKVGQTLSATTGSWSGTPTSFAYAWQDCNATGGACAPNGGTDSSYVLKTADVGHTVRVVVTATNPAGSTPATSLPTAVVTSAGTPPANLTLPKITGTPKQGQTLTASTGTWSGSPTSFAYQWEDCNGGGNGCQDIDGATSQTYLLKTSDVGHTIRVEVTATNASGSAPATSAATSVVAAGVSPPVLILNPLVIGVPQQGQPLFGYPGLWQNNPRSFALQWQRCDKNGSACTAIPGANGVTYVVTSADAGHTLRISVTATNSGGSTTATSAATALVPVAKPANLTAPSINGSAKQGQTLTASNGTWSNSPTSFTYQWQSCDWNGRSCDSIRGATARTYVPVAGDVGDTLRAVVTATNAGGSASATSDATDVIKKK